MFSLAYGRPLAPGASVQYTGMLDRMPDTTSCVFTTVRPGGYGTLTVGLQRRMSSAGMVYASLPRPVDVLPLGHVELWHGSFLCFAGRIVRRRFNAAGVVGFVANGYGLEAVKDDFVTSQDTALLTSGVLLARILARRAPLLQVATLVDPGLLHSMSEYNGMTPATVLNAMISEGGRTGTIWDYWVYEGQRLTFAPRIPPSVPDYLIPFDDSITDWEEDYTNLVAAVSVQYTNLDSASGATAITDRISDPSFAATYGISRAAPVQGGKMHTSVAEAFGKTWLATQNVPATSLQVVRHGMGLERYAGGEARPWTVRADSWVQPADQLWQPIVRTEYDTMAGQLTVEGGQPIPNGDQLVRGLAQVSAHVVRGTNPTTGARA